MKTTLSRILFLCFLSFAMPTKGQQLEITWSTELSRPLDQVFSSPDQMMYAVQRERYPENVTDKVITILKFDEAMKVIKESTIDLDKFPEYNYLEATYWAGDIVLFATHPSSSSGLFTLCYLPIDPVTLQHKEEFIDILEVPETGTLTNMETIRYNRDQTGRTVIQGETKLSTSPGGLFVFMILPTKTKGREALILLGPDKKLVSNTIISHSIHDPTFVSCDLEVTDSGEGYAYTGMSTWNILRTKMERKDEAIHRLGLSTGYHKLKVPSNGMVLLVSLYQFTPNEVQMGGLFSSAPDNSGEKAGLYLWQPDGGEAPKLIEFNQEEKSKLGTPRELKKNSFLAWYINPSLMKGDDGLLYFSAERLDQPGGYISGAGTGGQVSSTTVPSIMGQTFAGASHPETGEVIWTSRIPRRVSYTRFQYISTLIFLDQNNLTLLQNDSKRNLEVNENIDRPAITTNISGGRAFKPAPILTTYSPDGKMDRSILGFIDESIFTIDPEESRILADGSVIVFADRNEKYILGRIRPE